MKFQVIIKRSAMKSLEQVSNPYYDLIKEAIYALADDPRPMGYKKLRGREGYRIRVGQYRVIYDIRELVLIVEVIAIGHRKDVY
jgi:mRNA interferase RelE/StbE